MHLVFEDPKQGRIHNEKELEGRTSDSPRVGKKFIFEGGRQGGKSIMRMNLEYKLNTIPVSELSRHEE